MKPLLIAILPLLAVSCTPQYPQKLNYKLNAPYASMRDKISQHNLASETDFGWTTDRVRVDQREISSGKKFVFQRVTWAPDTGEVPEYRGELTKNGSGSTLSLTELPNPRYAVDGPRVLLGASLNVGMEEFDDWASSNLPINDRSLIEDDTLPALYGSAR